MIYGCNWLYIFMVSGLWLYLLHFHQRKNIAHLASILQNCIACDLVHRGTKEMSSCCSCLIKERNFHNAVFVTKR